MVNKIMISLILLIVFTVTFGSITSLAQHPGNIDTGEQTGTITFSDYNAVGTSWETAITEVLADKSIIDMVFELTWTDDEGSNSDPDTFNLQMNDERHEPKSDSGSGGTVSISWDEDDLNNVWNVAVTCDAAGPTQVPVGPIGIITQEEPDPGNSWKLVVTYTYTEGGGGPGGPPAEIQALLKDPIFWIHVGLMVSSTYIFLLAGVFAGVFLLTKDKWKNASSKLQRIVSRTDLLLILVIVAFIAFFLASVPIGMYVAGKAYGPHMAWSGFPAIWHPEAWMFTNADNVSLIVLALWAIPIYLNRRPIMRGKWFKKLFGGIDFLMERAEKAPEPKLLDKELALCYFFMGLFVYLVFMVQPHGF